ncbi:MAG TPA: tRNA uridine-5-carboxymethylaminomethyl(34) synthesis GTPase MnmE [Acholeplasmatales bacterium]|nr:tRNA uridine-5-carboxymethylaminomethyl(34) synthesis GTPase MnmE [Acholeplasmatales bacterium]
MEDTIVAVSTALSKSAISIVRASGPEAIAIVSQIFKGKDLKTAESHTISYGHIVDGDEIIDEVLVSVFRAPKTYTTEDIVEINCHGGMYVTNRILGLLLEKGGRTAEPGEFTKRAFLNGRIDLTQAEAVTDLIDAKTSSSLKMANLGLRGDIRKMIEDFRSRLLTCMAKIEVNIDYPEYLDEEQINGEILKPAVREMLNEITKILDKSKVSAILKEGISTAIIGKPNVGKSSLLNALLREDRAIVTDIAGTTRDTIEGTANLGGLVLNLIDTAGIRQTTDTIERIGVEKAKKIIDRAALIILVFDYSTPLTEDDYRILELTEKKERIIVVNKQDLKKQIDLSRLKDYQLISAFNQADIEKLENKIRTVCQISDLVDLDYTYVGNARQIAKLKQAKDSLEDALSGIENRQPSDIVNLDLTAAWKILGEIIGETVEDELVSEMFSKFCLGK